MKGRVQNVAVVAPVRTEYQDHALVVFGGGSQRGADLGLSLFRRRIKIYVWLRRLRRTTLWIRLKVASLRCRDSPIAALLNPNLRALNHERLLARTRSQHHLHSKNYIHLTRLRTLYLEDFHIYVGRTLGLQSGPKARLRGRILHLAFWRLHLAWRNLQIHLRERGLILAEDCRPPAIERFKCRRARRTGRL